MILLVICALLYFLPSLVAYQRHGNAPAIFIMNLLLGWTFLGWVAALVWACTGPPIERPREPLSRFAWVFLTCCGVILVIAATA
jgi:uncharacterized membrane protein YqaE (UPF0057 family)